MTLVKIVDGGMRNGCVGTLESSHGEWEFQIRFEDGRFSYFLASQFQVLGWLYLQKVPRCDLARKIE